MGITRWGLTFLGFGFAGGFYASLLATAMNVSYLSSAFWDICMFSILIGAFMCVIGLVRSMGVGAPGGFFDRAGGAFGPHPPQPDPDVINTEDTDKKLEEMEQRLRETIQNAQQNQTPPNLDELKTEFNKALEGIQKNIDALQESMQQQAPNDDTKRLIDAIINNLGRMQGGGQQVLPIIQGIQPGTPVQQQVQSLDEVLRKLGELKSLSEATKKEVADLKSFIETQLLDALSAGFGGMNARFDTLDKAIADLDLSVGQKLDAQKEAILQQFGTELAGQIDLLGNAIRGTITDQHATTTRDVKDAVKSAFDDTNTLVTELEKKAGVNLARVRGAIREFQPFIEKELRTTKEELSQQAKTSHSKLMANVNSYHLRVNEISKKLGVISKSVKNIEKALGDLVKSTNNGFDDLNKEIEEIKRRLPEEGLDALVKNFPKLERTVKDMNKRLNVFFSGSRVNKLNKKLFAEFTQIKGSLALLVSNAEVEGGAGLKAAIKELEILLKGVQVTDIPPDIEQAFDKEFGEISVLAGHCNVNVQLILTMIKKGVQYISAEKDAEKISEQIKKSVSGRRILEILSGISKQIEISIQSDQPFSWTATRTAVLESLEKINKTYSKAERRIEEFITKYEREIHKPLVGVPSFEATGRVAKLRKFFDEYQDKIKKLRAAMRTCRVALGRTGDGAIGILSQDVKEAEDARTYLKKAMGKIKIAMENYQIWVKETQDFGKLVQAWHYTLHLGPEKGEVQPGIIKARELAREKYIEQKK